MNCTEIITLITSHTDYDCTVFICENEWANEPNGVIIADDIKPNFAIKFLKDITPKDWTLTVHEDESTICIGFIL